MAVEHERLIRQKLTNMAAYVDELAPYLKGTLREYVETPGRRRIVERLAQVIVECAIDTNGLLIEQAGIAPPATAWESFAVAGRLGALDAHVIGRFQRYVGLRNRIVHDYDVLDNSIVYHTVRRLVDDAGRYIQQVYNYLKEK